MEIKNKYFGSDIFVIPTHRKCEKSVNSIVYEMKKNTKNKKVILLVIDNSKKDIYMENSKLLFDIAKENDFPVYHIGINDIKSIVRIIADAINEEFEVLEEMLVPNGIDYGKIYNIIYVLIGVLGGEVFHRRDSDCYYDNCIEELDYAVQYEDKYLGTSINKVKNQLEIIEDINYEDNEEICIVGSDYIGNWNLDLDELMNSSNEVARRLLEICDVPQDGIEQQLNDVYNKSINRESRKPVLKNTFKVVKVPECGNMSMKEVFKYLPNLFGRNGMGFDYFTYFISFLYKVPIVFHYNPILHIHDSKRYEDIDLFNYWKGIVKMVDLDIIYTNIIRTGVIDNIIKERSGLETLKNTISREFTDGLQNIVINMNYEYRSEKYENVVKDILISSNLPKYVSIGKKLIDVKKQIFDELDKEYMLSIKLIRLWNKIMRAAYEGEFKDINPLI